MKTFGRYTKEKRAQHTTVGSHQITKERAREEGAKNYSISETVHRMAICTYLLINTFENNELNSPEYREAEWIKKK